MIFDDALNRIERGMKGLNVGLPMGFDRLREFVPDIQQSTYYLIGGETGSGKSAFANNCFVYNPIDYLISNPECPIKLKVKIWSFEIDKASVISKAICRKMYLHYGKLVDVNYVLSRGKNRIDAETYELVKSMRDDFEPIEDMLEIFDGTMNPTGVNKHMLKYAADNGDLIFNEVPGEDGPIKIFDKYIPNDPNLYTIMLIDHIALSKKERGMNTKETIDKMSEYMIPLRNNFGFTPVVVQQLGRSLSSSDRFKLDRVEPQLSDFKDSGNTQQDANVIFSLFAPGRYEIEDFRGFNIRKLRDRYRNLTILKNRDGESDIRVPLQFVGEVGHFQEIPNVQKFKEDPTLYDKVVNLENYEN